MFGSGGGWEYSFMFSKQRSDSVISLFGRNGNFSLKCGVCGWGFLTVNEFV